MYGLGILVIVMVSVHGLTESEVKQFHNSGQYGGNVTVVTNFHGHMIYSNGIPDHPTERVNPNTPTKQNFHFHISATPSISNTPGCLSMGPIGITRTGVAIFNPYTNGGQNAVEGVHAEIFDSCDGHPDMQGIYHYHKIPDSCLYKGHEDELIGVALDGFPIYGPKASDLGRDVVETDLDECHGRMVNGNYRYHVTTFFPYYLGCYKGSGVHRATYDCDTSDAKNGGYVCSCPHNQHMGTQQLGGQHVGGQQPSGGEQYGYPPHPTGLHPSWRPWRPLPGEFGHHHPPPNPYDPFGK